MRKRSLQTAIQQCRIARFHSIGVTGGVRRCRASHHQRDLTAQHHGLIGAQATKLGQRTAINALVQLGQFACHHRLTILAQHLRHVGQ